jgi:hypothetical protein
MEIAVKKLTSIVIFLNVCGKSPGVDHGQFKSMWHTSASVNGQNTMEGYYESCSQGYTTFLEKDNYIFPDEVLIPCVGEIAGSVWNATQCTFYELYGWVNYTDNYMRDAGNIDLTQYSRKIYIIPYNPKCRFVGKADIGCRGSPPSCKIWLNGGSAVTLGTMFHEIGHSMGLAHSSTPIQEYGDYSCAMGGIAGVRCFNAPQNWFLGWARTNADLNTSNLEENVWKSFTIPPQTSVRNNMVRISTNWGDNKTYSQYFISFRSRVNYDIGLYKIYSNAISIHRYNNLGKTSYMGMPVLLKVLKIVDQVWIESTQKIAIRLNSINDGVSASISVCRFLNNIDECIWQIFIL